MIDTTAVLPADARCATTDQEATASLLIAALPDYAICMLDRDGRVMSWNPGVLQVDGYSAPEILGRDLSVFFTATARSAGEPARALEIARTEGRFAAETVLVRKDGTTFWADVLLRPIQDDAGRQIGFARIVRDISERKRLEQATALAAAVFDNSPDAIILVDRSGAIVEANHRASELFGYGADSLVGRTVEDLMPTGMRVAHRQHRTKFFADPAGREMGTGLELLGRRADGSELPVDIMISPFAATNGSAMAIATIRDVSDRKRAAAEHAETVRAAATVAERAQGAAALASAGETLQRIIDASPLPMVMIGGDDRVAIWNNAAEEVYRLPADRALGRPWHEIAAMFPAVGGVGETGAMLATVRREGSLRAIPARRLRPDGSIFDLSISGALLAEDGRDTGSVLFIADDVTARRSLEEQLRQSQRVEAIGQLTGGVAHDFNNILAIVQGNLELIQEGVGDDASLSEMAGDALRATARGASLTHRLLAYSRQQQLSPTTVEIGPLLAGLTDVLRRVIEASVAIETVAAPGLWNANIDAGQLESALINLAVNGRDAMPRGGRLTISAENLRLDEDQAGQFVDGVPGDYVLLSVSDTGTGMSKATAAKALEPFFTTKPVGKGTGLGLSMVYGFARQSGGHIRIYSEVGIGTTIKLFLPRAPGESEMPGSDMTPAVAKPRGKPVVLVVEDEERVRNLQARALRQLGYETLEAGDAITALDLVERAPRVDLLLTDVVLPGAFTGPELASVLCRENPAMRVVLMSGYAPNAVVRADSFKDAPVLSKPFSRAALARALDQAINADEHE